MNPCHEYAVRVLRYLDNDLTGQEVEDFHSHSASCADCRARLEAETSLSQTLRRSRPLYLAPAALRERVAAMAAQPSGNRDQDRVDQQTQGLFGKALSGFPARPSNRRVLIPGAIVLTLCLVLTPGILRNVQAARYVEAAVVAHRNQLRGNPPSELQSTSAEEVTDWFAQKVLFHFRLPTAESTPEKNPSYRLTGAALVNYKGSPAALVTYETQYDKISLLVDSSNSAIVAGGAEIRFGNLTFHYHTKAGFKIITWSTHGLSYALVSSVSGLPRASCVVCRQNMADGGDFKTHP